MTLEANSSTSLKNQAVQERWGGTNFPEQLDHAFWMNHSVVRGYQNRLATGSAACDWLTWLANDWLPTDKPLRVLVLGCGDGWLERAIAGRHFVDKIDAVDIAGDAVERARKAAEHAGITNIHYGVLDLNHATLPERAYDVVIAHSVLHHIENLEHAFATISASLKPDGWIAINEFVGPAHLQYSDRAMAAISELMSALPARLRCSALFDKAVYDLKHRPGLEQAIADDPSEGVRAPELDGFIRQWFSVAYETDIGGTVLQLLLWDMVNNFREDCALDRSLLEWICLLEETLVVSANLPSDYRFYICQARGAEAEPAIEACRPKRLAPSRDLPTRSTPPTNSGPPTNAREHSTAVARALTRSAESAFAGAKPWLLSALREAETGAHDAPMIWLGGPRELADGLVQSFPKLMPMGVKALLAIVRAGSATLVISRPAGLPIRKIAALALMLRRRGSIVMLEPTGAQAPADLAARFGQCLASAVDRSWAQPEHGLRIERDQPACARSDQRLHPVNTGGQLLGPILGTFGAQLAADEQADAAEVLSGIEAVLARENVLPPTVIIRVQALPGIPSLVAALVTGRILELAPEGARY